MDTEQSSLPKNEENSGMLELSLALRYQQHILDELLNEDELVIMGRGLGLHRIVTNMLYTYGSVRQSLVVLIGADDREIEWIGEGLAELSMLNRSRSRSVGLTVVNTESLNIEKRELAYNSGGVFYVTSRILVVDMLSGIIPVEKVTGVAVLHAEKVSATSTEAFILRLFREKNKNGFIKAFSDSPESFAGGGFSPLTTSLKNLFLTKPSLWPRFQVEVAESLSSKNSKRRKDIVEIDVAMTQYMKEIQTATLECIETSMRELRKSTSAVLDFEDEDWVVETALQNNFDVRIRRQLDPVWHRLSQKSRQLVFDLSTLRQILNYLFEYDCVSFLQALDVIVAANSSSSGTTKQNISPWLLMDAANVIFLSAQQRVFASSESPDESRKHLDEDPKWEQLAEILDEVTEDMLSRPRSDSVDWNGSSVLIMCGSERTCQQLKDYLSLYQSQAIDDDLITPGNILLRRKLREYNAWKKDFASLKNQLFTDSNNKVSNQANGNQGSNVSAENKLRTRQHPPNKRRRIRGGSQAASSSNVLGPHRVEDRSESSSMFSDGDNSLSDQQNEAFDIISSEMCFEVCNMSDVISIIPYDGDMDDFVLEEQMPRYIIMYEPDPAFARRIEVYRSTNPDRELKVYFMYYGGSIEEQRYLSAVRREKDAFSKLIRERGTMSMVLTAENEQLVTPEDAFLRKVNTRIAGGGRFELTVAPPRVVVDLREFRSSLPSLLHGRQMLIAPSMLVVGDYILSPDICVERKSVVDLISSFRDGRLYQQCEVMTRHYKIVVLLIEFDHNKSFSLEPFSEVSSTLAATTSSVSQDLQSKIVLLTIAFPDLRIIWSSSPYQTADIFLELKRNQLEPDPEHAAAVGLEEDGDHSSSLTNQTAIAMLKAMPGITEVNYRNIVYDVDDFKQLCVMSEDEIARSIGPEAAKKVWRFINRDLKAEAVAIE
ncbi:hypothetical protein V1511DRAFT_482576 [Dipodascopsis uninucleata]